MEGDMLVGETAILQPYFQMLAQMMGREMGEEVGGITILGRSFERIWCASSGSGSLSQRCVFFIFLYI